MRNERDFSSASGAGAGQGVGARLPRKEDDRLMRGRGQFVADIRLAGLQDVAFVRSPLAHARIRGNTCAGALSRQRLHRGRSGRRQADPRGVGAAGLQGLRAAGARHRQGPSGRRTRRDVRRADARRGRGHCGGRDARSRRASRRLRHAARRASRVRRWCTSIGATTSFSKPISRSIFRRRSTRRSR